jgi:hypothetical protein
MKRALFVLLVCFPWIPSAVFAQTGTDWPMTAANPQQTIWVSEFNP